MTLGIPQLFSSKICLIACAHNLYNILHFKSKFYRTLYEEGPAWAFMNFFHAWASAAMPSKLEGSRKWIFISYLAFWFLTTPILARLRCSCSSSKWILTATWATAFFIICSYRSLTCWISYLSSWYLLCRCSMNSSCSGIAFNLFFCGNLASIVCDQNSYVVFST